MQGNIRSQTAAEKHVSGKQWLDGNARQMNEANIAATRESTSENCGRQKKKKKPVKARYLAELVEWYSCSKFTR